MTAPAINVYTVPCRYCRAAPGRECRGGYPIKLVKPHASRSKDALAVAALLSTPE